MKELVLIRNNNIFTDSLIISNGTGNKHISIKELIMDYKSDFLDFGTLSVLNRESTGGRPEQYYLLNEEQATFLMTLLRNSKIVVAFKKELVKQFYAMRQLLFEKRTIEWQTTRKQGKLTRKAETDIIKQLVECAKKQGSIHSDKLYVAYSKLANKIIGVTEREKATTFQLNNLTTAEHIILHSIQEGIKENKYYKEIYTDCKSRLKEFVKVSYLQEVI